MGVFCKKWTFPQRRVHYVHYQYFFIFHFTYLGVCTHLTHPPAYGPEKPATFTEALKRQCAAAGKPRELTTALLSDIHTPSICYYYYICCRCYIFVTGTLNARRVWHTILSLRLSDDPLQGIALMGLLQLRYEHDSSTIRARYDILRGVMCFRAIMSMSILLRCCRML